jgi:hypothetical protein
VNPAGRRVRLAVGLTIAAVVGIGLAALAAPAALAARAVRSAAPSPTPTSSNAPNRVSITLQTLEPKAVQPHDTVLVDGTVTNISGSPLSSVSVALRASTHRIDTRYDLTREADPANVLGSTVSNTRQSLGSLAVDQTVSWHFSLQVDRLDLPNTAADFGAYPFAVDVRSTAAATTLTTRLPTTLMWMPTGSQFVQTQISWLLPLVDGIHRGEGDAFLDDQLADDLAPTGRLGRLLDFASNAGVPMTYLVDPALVDDATVMAGASALTNNEPTGGVTGVTGIASASPKPASKASAAPKGGPKSAAASASAAAPTVYQVTAGQGTADGTGQSAAATWLATLRTDVSAPGAALVGLPYGDTDLVAVERAGLAREMAIARSTGQSTLSADLAPPTLPNVVWPIGGTLDDATLDDLAGDLVDTVVLSDTTLPPRDPNAVTGARTNLQTESGTIRAVLTDSTLSSMLTAPPAADGVRAAEQRFLAQTMLVTEQRPGAGSSIVIAPPRNWDPAGGFAATLLSDTASMPWLEGANLGQVAGQPADGVPRKSLVYPAAAQAAELPSTELQPIVGLRSTLAACSAILGSSTAETFINTATIAILRAESSGLRGDPARSAAIRAAVQAELDSQTAKVYIVKPGLITLTSRKQKIPITVVNNFPDPVTVQIRLTAVNAARLVVSAQQPFTVPGNQSRHEVLIEVEATTGGRFQVSAQLWTPDANPRPFGSTVPFILNSTAYGAVALVIAGTAAGLVFLLSAIRIARRISRARRAHAAAAAAESEPADATPVP